MEQYLQISHQILLFSCKSSRVLTQTQLEWCRRLLVDGSSGDRQSGLLIGVHKIKLFISYEANDIVSYMNCLSLSQAMLMAMSKTWKERRLSIHADKSLDFPGNRWHEGIRETPAVIDANQTPVANTATHVPVHT